MSFPNITLYNVQFILRCITTKNDKTYNILIQNRINCTNLEKKGINYLETSIQKDEN